MADLLRTAGRDLVRTRADRVGLVVLAAMVVLLSALALAGVGFGAFGLLYLGGSLVPAALLWATGRSAKWRKPAALVAVLLLPAWAALGLLALVVSPGLEPFGPGVMDLGPGLGAFLRGVVMTGAILGLMRLFGPEEGGRR